MKFKNIKKKHKVKNNKAKSPSNSRSIPVFAKASFIRLYGLSLKIFIVAIFFIAVVVVGADLIKNIEEKQRVDHEKEKLTKELSFWKSSISEHKDYRDAYFQASVLEYKLGNTSKAKMYVQKGLLLDPNSENGKKIKELLDK